MAKRITELVNEILVAEEKDGGLSTEQVLDLIDTGRSEGGAEVHSCCALLSYARKFKLCLIERPDVKCLHSMPRLTTPSEQVQANAQGRHWVLDPIDGTRGFVGRRQYAVCLGLLDGGKVSVCI